MDEGKEEVDRYGWRGDIWMKGKKRETDTNGGERKMKEKRRGKGEREREGNLSSLQYKDDVSHALAKLHA